MNEKIKFDKRNYRKHTDKNKRLIKKSLEEYGAGRSILIDSENEIIAGNGVAEQWGNKPIRIIETDGTELIAIKRKDLKPDDEKRKKLALLDNVATDTLELEFDIIKKDFDKQFLKSIEMFEDGYFQRTLSQQEEFEYEKIKWPVTICINEDDYKKWEKIKSENKEKNDLKMFIKLLNNI